MKGFFNPDNKRLSLRKFLSSKLFQRGGFGVLALTIFTSILTMPRIAHAGFWDGLMDILFKAALGLVGLITGMLLVIGGTVVYTLAWAARYIAEFAINLSINFSYTSGPIFNAGWPVLRDLANMGLILILVGIGVGTMLNLRLNKNRLPMFLLVAILINLTPVITGVVIDFSNIIANVFFASARNALGAAIGNSPIDTVTSGGQLLINTASQAAGSGMFDLAFLSVLVIPILTIAIGIVLIFTFLLLAALFMGRIVALLILVILSPVAFLGLIFQGGQGRRLWDRWWNTFFQWAIIAIPLIFFLWLGGIFLNAGPQLCDPENMQITPNTPAELEQALSFPDDPDSAGDTALPMDVFICQTSVTFFAIAAIMVGVMLSFKSSAAGAGIIINKAKAVQRGASKRARQAAGAPGRYAGRKAGQGARRAAEKPAARISQRLNDSKLAQLPVVGGAIRNAATAARKPIEQIQKEVQNYEKQFRQIKDFGQLRASLYAGGDEGFAAMRVASDKFSDEFAKEMEGSEKLQKAFGLHRKRSQIRQDKLDEDILKKMPHMAKDASEKSRLAQKTTYSDLQKMPHQALGDAEFMNSLLENENINYNALHDAMRQSPEKRDALLDSFGKIRDMRDPENNKAFEQVLDEIDAGKRKNHLKRPIMNAPLVSARFKSKRDRGTETMRENIASDAARQLPKVEEEIKKLDEEIQTQRRRASGEGLELPGRYKEESEKKLQELEKKKNTLESKRKTYEANAFQKEPKKSRGGRNRGDVQNQMDSVRDEMRDIREQMKRNDIEQQEREELSDRLEELDTELENLQNGL